MSISRAFFKISFWPPLAHPLLLAAGQVDALLTDLGSIPGRQHLNIRDQGAGFQNLSKQKKCETFKQQKRFFLLVHIFFNTIIRTEEGPIPSPQKTRLLSF